MIELKKTARAAALKHTAREYPREACGLLVRPHMNAGDKRQKPDLFVPCANTAENKEEHFRISAEAFVDACKVGEVVGVFHSHPDASPRPSSTDLSACDVSGVTWYIVSYPEINWCNFEPFDPKSELYGREFLHGHSDCYSFVRSWYVQNRGVDFGPVVREDEWWKSGNESMYLENYRRVGLELVTDGSMQEGDVVLMQVAANVPNHGAIYLGGDQIGHHLYGRLSSRDVYGGYWRRHTTHVLRLKEQKQ
jgi:proteasome lid subunit RPN8/RPN11